MFFNVSLRENGEEGLKQNFIHSLKITPFYKKQFFSLILSSNFQKSLSFPFKKVALLPNSLF